MLALYTDKRKGETTLPLLCAIGFAACGVFVSTDVAPPAFPNGLFAGAPKEEKAFCGCFVAVVCERNGLNAGAGCAIGGD